MGKIMKLFALCALFFCVFFITSSCELPTTTGLSLTNDDDTSGDDNKKEDVKPTPKCGIRDSCQDTCDDMFYGQSERYKCTQLDFNEVNALVIVHDELKEVVDKDDLKEDVNADDFEQYLSIGLDSFIRRIEGKFEEYSGDKQWDGTAQRRDNSIELLSWIAENEDIAEIILAQDTRFEIARGLFKNIHEPHNDVDRKNVAVIGQTYQTSGNFASGEADGIVISSTGIYKDSVGTSLTDSIVSFRRGDGNDVPAFVDGFVQEEFSKDSFIKFALDERNDSAFEWAHNALVDLCEDATRESKEDVEVKQCVLAVYCTHRAVEHNSNNYEYKANSSDNWLNDTNAPTEVTGDGIFKKLKSSIIGRIDDDPEDYCKANADDEGLYDEDRIEDLFE